MPNCGSQKVFLGHLDDNFMMYKIVVSPYYSLLNKHSMNTRPHSAQRGLGPSCEEDAPQT